MQSGEERIATIAMRTEWTRNSIIFDGLLSKAPLQNPTLLLLKVHRDFDEVSSVSLRPMDRLIEEREVLLEEWVMNQAQCCHRHLPPFPAKRCVSVGE